tara:strand:- start:3147 stop:3560 length:414 start_codon:yes stop_codon:yes gene_type:complete
MVSMKLFGIVFSTLGCQNCFFLLPLFALIIAWLYTRQKRGMMPHFLFALHFHSSLFFMGIIYAVVSYIFRKLEWLIFNQIFLGLCGLYLAYYLWKSLRRMYSESRLKKSFKFIILVVLYGILLIAFTFILLLFSYNY